MKPKRNPEAGFALLFVYAMAATVAIMLLMQLPSVAFEAQRDREQLLIDRGEQYTRAVQLYVRKFNRYPPDFDALDNTQSMRFLRHRYQDPLTGKDEWRLIHVGPGGVFTDSLVYNTKKQDPNAPAGKQTFITEIPTVNTDPNSTEGVNLATRRVNANGQLNPNDPNSPQSGMPGSALPSQGYPGQVLPGQGYPGQILPGQQATDPNQPQQTIPGALPPGVQLPPGMQLPPGFQSANGQTPSQLAPQGLGTNLPGQATSSAANMINQLLTTPRPGGLAGLSSTPTSGAPQSTVDAFGNPVSGTTATPQQGQPGNGQQPQQAGIGTTVGGGIAGVASKVDRKGIKIYNERKLYKEWEFVYDITKDISRAGGAAGQPVPAQNASGLTATGQSAAGQGATGQTAAPQGVTAPQSGATSQTNSAASGSIAIFGQSPVTPGPGQTTQPNTPAQNQPTPAQPDPNQPLPTQPLPGQPVPSPPPQVGR